MARRNTLNDYVYDPYNARQAPNDDQAGRVDPNDTGTSGPSDTGGGLTNDTQGNATTTPTTTTPSGSLKDTIWAILQKYDHTPAGLAAALPEIQRLYPNAKITGSKGDKLDLTAYGGKITDVITSAGTGGTGWQWDDGTGSTGTTSGTPMTVDPSYLQPWTQVFQPGADTQIPGVPDYPEFQGIGEFKAPTADSIYQDPAFKFRMDEGRRALENSKAAAGVLNSGGTLADVLNYGQQAASQEYSNIWNRDWSKYAQDWNNAYQMWSGNGTLANTKYNAAKDTANTNYSRQWQNYLTARDTFYQNQSNPWSKLYQAAGLGANSAGA